MSAPPRQDLIRQLLSVLSLLILIGGSLWVMQPFLAALIWATMITVATWPVLLWVQARLGGRRAPATALMLLALLLLFFAPLALAILTLVSHLGDALEWLRALDASRLAEPPAWLGSVPELGPRLAQLWREAAQGGVGALVAKLSPYTGTLARGALRQVSALGMVGLQFLTTVVICGVLYLEGERAAQGLRQFAHRLAGARGVHMVTLAGHAARGVAMGVVLTAVAQALLGGLGVLVAGVPGALLLTAVMFLLTIAQIGPLPVLLTAAGWLAWSGQTQSAVGLLLWSGVVGTIDNLIRPWLIRKGADLPLLLIFAGVVGGLVAFGLLGIFIGPVILAVTYTLMASWIQEDMSPPGHSSDAVSEDPTPRVTSGRDTPI